MERPEILTAMTTPFDADGEANIPHFGELLNRLEPLVDGVFVAGTTGEFLALTENEHARLVESALEVFGPERVVAHVGAPSIAASTRLARRSRELGVTRFAVLTPYYLRATIAEVQRHWGSVAEACEGECYGYIFPDVATTDVRPDDLSSLLDLGITGLKISGSASLRVKEYLAAAPAGFKLWSGNDADLPNVMDAGGTGTVSGVSGVVPWPWAALRDAITSGESAQIDLAQSVIDRLVPALGPSIANLKYGLDLQHLPGGACRMTIDSPNAPSRATIEDALRIAQQYEATHNDEGVEA